MRNTTILLLTLLSFTACTPGASFSSEAQPDIFPDYRDITVPSNIAPLGFSLSGESKPQYAVFETSSASFKARTRNGLLLLGCSRWKKLLETAGEEGIKVTVTAKEDEGWTAYSPFSIKVAEPIDPYVTYRLIEPGYEIWYEMGIYQRNLENFKETAVIENNMTDNGCVNCHSFRSYDQSDMLFHARVGYNGTYVIRNGEIEKLNTKTDETVSALVYPQWHPSGRYVAFSVNNTKQMFHSTSPNRVEVFDYTSDVVIYDVENHQIFSSPELKAKGVFETFPSFSPDGKSLYFCSADSLKMPDSYDQVKYSLCRLSFDPETGSFGSRVDTLVNSRETGRSVSFPRVSPVDMQLMFTMSDYGNFSIWHQDSDLCLVDLNSGAFSPMAAANSDSVDSYHCWSSNGRWVIFSSRRLDGLYTRLFIAHIDEESRVSKAFLLPQKRKGFYDSLIKSYNIPELSKGRIELDKYELHKVARDSKGTDLRFRH